MTVNVLFVCLGNICRSPTSQGVFERRLIDAGLEDKVSVDSAGTASFHIGKSPDPRAIKAADAHGFDISGQTARQISLDDFDRFHYIIAMDHMNLGNIKPLAPKSYEGEIQLFMEYMGKGGLKQVPDPYKHGQEAFEKAIQLIERASDALLTHIVAQHFTE